MKIKKSTLVSIIVLSIITMFSSYSFSQNGEGYLMIRAYESRDKGYSKIIVTENGEKIEEVELTPIYYKDLATPQIEINKILDKYESNGYELRHMTSGGDGLYLIITTYLFKKE